MSNEIAVVTGAGGFIGSRLVARLLDDGVDVRALVHYGVDGGNGLLGGLSAARRRSLDVRAGDLRDADWVRRSLVGAGRVFHLGAIVSIPYSYRSPRDVMETNVVGTLNVLEAARDAGVPRVIQTSTSEVYGSAQVTPMSESHPLSAQSPYAATKIAADQLALSWFRSFELPVSIVRPFNTYGPGQSARAIIPTIITQALAGSSVRLGSVTPTRDFNYVDDTVSAFVAVSEAAAAVGEVFNVGTGVETSVGRIVELVSASLGKELTVITDEERVRPAGSEVNRLHADATKLRHICGWEPKVPVAEGITRTVAWIRENPQRFDPGRYAV
ncbi:MAG: GDP-mannose 4,6-dehydratase [Thermoanaerobaculia bacterium]|jgi:dTDP-glucose 4,6-dehydratase